MEISQELLDHAEVMKCLPETPEERAYSAAVLHQAISAVSSLYLTMTLTDRRPLTPDEILEAPEKWDEMKGEFLKAVRYFTGEDV